MVENALFRVAHRDRNMRNENSVSNLASFLIKNVCRSSHLADVYSTQTPGQPEGRGGLRGNLRMLISTLEKDSDRDTHPQ